jgi:hypothetical protein
MVNVNTPLPFNLHNKALHGRHDPSSSRSTRSRSAHPVMGGLAESGTEILPDLPSRVSSYSPIRDRDLSPSHTSRSTTSLHPGDASYLPPEADPDGGVRRPILNARLVRGNGGYSVGGKFGPRKGRSATRGRVGQSSDSTGSDVPESAGDATAKGEPIEEQETDQSSSEAVRYASGSVTANPITAAVRLQDVGKITCSWGD